MVRVTNGRLAFTAVLIVAAALAALQALSNDSRPVGGVEPHSPSAGSSNSAPQAGARVTDSVPTPRVDEAPTDASGSMVANLATVSLMDTVTRREPIGSRWLAESSQDTSERVEFTSGTGAIALRPGWWRLSCVDDSWATVQGGGAPAA